MRRRKTDIFDKSWVTIATIVGIIAVVVIALVFFWGNGGLTGAPSSGQAAANSGSSTASAVSTSAGQSAQTVVVAETTTQAVPPTGVYAHVSYIGGYKGTYGMPPDLQTVQSSGDRYFEIVNATGSIQASFRKLDSSTKHDLTVEIYKDGKVLKFANNSSAYGVVSVSYQL